MSRCVFNKQNNIEMERDLIKKQAEKINLESNGLIAIVSGSADFQVGDKVKTRSDMGSLNFEIVAIHNNHYCTCKGYGKLRHFNMGYLEHYR
jgi:hypothetical protein